MHFPGAKKWKIAKITSMGVICTMPKREICFGVFPYFWGGAFSIFQRYYHFLKLALCQAHQKILTDQIRRDQTKLVKILMLWHFELLEQTLVATLELKFGGDFEAKFGHSKLHFSKYVNAEVKSIEVWLRFWSWSLVDTL